MKVLFVQNIEGIAGSEKYFLQLLPSLKKNGVIANFLCVHKPEFSEISDKFCTQLETLGIKVHRIETRSYVSLKLLRNIKNIVRDSNYQILHSHLIYADFWSACLRSFLKSRKIITVSTLHGYQENIYTQFCLKPTEVPHNLYYRIARFTYPRIDFVYACSAGLKSFFLSAGIQFKKEPAVIHHGFDYAPVADPLKANNGDHFICAIPGRLVPRKGHILVLRHIKSISEKVKNFKLLIIGDGPSRNELETYCRENNLTEVVQFTGNVPDVRPLIKSADLVLIPSYAEGLPLVIFEAMSLSKPVIAFDTIGPAEVIDNGKTGYLIPPFDDQKFAEKIIETASDLPRLKEIGLAGYSHYNACHTLETMTRNTISYYTMCLNSRPF